MRIADVFVAVRADMTDVNKAFSGLETGLGNVQKSLGNMGASMTRNVTLPILAIGGGATKMAVDFETSMNRMVGLAGVSRESLEGVREQIGAIGAETGQGPQELADAFYFVASAGFEAEGAMEVLNASAMAAASGMGQVGDVAKVLGGVVNSYGQENLTAARAADILAAAVASGAAEADAFAAVLPQVVPSAALLGVELEEVAGSIAAMTVGGASASMAAVGLNAVFTSLLKPSVEAEKTLAQFGLTAGGLRDQLESEGVISVLRTLESTFGDNDEAMTSVFGNIRAMRGAFSLLGLDAEQLDGIMSDVANSQDRLQMAFEATDDEGRSLAKGWSKLQFAMIELGRDLMPTVVEMFRKLIEVVRGVSKWWKGLSDETKNTIINFALVAAAAGPVLTILSKLVGVAKFAVVGIKGLVLAGKLMHTAWVNIPTVLGYADLA
ncbi:MAG: phage tail tape measure protein, partial [Acidimicrobiales bacterium]